MKSTSSLTLLSAAACSGLITVAAAATIPGLKNVTVPANLGPWAVSITQQQINTSRPDILAPTPQKRRLTVQIFEPTYPKDECPHYDTLPWASDAIDYAFVYSVEQAWNISLPRGCSSYVHLASCPLLPPPSSNAPHPPRSPPSKHCDDAPLLIFSPGFGNNKEYYSLMCQAVASSGYTVIATDHPYETDVVRFADGTYAYQQQNATDDATVLQYLATDTDIRIDDMESILDAVEHGKLPSLRGRFPPGGKPVTAGIFGHSLGGSTAVGAAQNDSARVLAALNYDGEFWSYINNDTLRRPLFILAEQNIPGFLEDNWDQVWNHTTAWKAQWQVNATQHNSYTDYPLWTQLTGLRKQFPALDAHIGTIDGERIQQIVWRYTVDFFDFAIKGKQPHLLVRPSPEFPDVTLDRQSNGTAKGGHA